MNSPFDRVNFGLRERPVSSDFNRAESQLDRTLRDLLRSMCGGRTTASSALFSYSGFIANGFAVVPSSPIAMSVQVTPGFGFINDAVDTPTDIGATDLEGVDDRSSFKPVFLNSPVVFPVATAPGAGQSRIDIIEARVDRRLEDAQTRRQLDVASKAFLDHSFFKTLAFGLDGRTGIVSNPAASTAGLSYKIGTAAATGAQVEPSTTAGYVKIAAINVGPSVTSINTDVMVDRRPLLYPGGCIPFGGRWRVQWNAGAPIITAIAIKSPPGVQVTLATLGLRGAGTLYVVGGEIATAAATLTASHQHGLDFTDRFSVGLHAANAFTGTQVVSVDSTIQGQLAAASPPVSVGIGAKVVTERIISRFITTTGVSNNTDTSLEDAIVEGTGFLSYV